MRNHPPRFAITVFFLLFALSLIVSLVIAQVMPKLIVNNDDSFVVDSNGNAFADEGDVIRYTVVIANCEGDAAQNVRYNSQLDANTELVPNSITQSGLEAAQNCLPSSNPVPTASNPTVVPANPAPFVQNSNPANGGTEVALDTNITLQFNKAVNVTGDWFEIVCTVSGVFNISSGNVTVTGGPINFTFDPNVDLQIDETCTVTVFAVLVNDIDNNDPPDNMATDHVFSFDTETPPTVTTTNPANGAVSVPNINDIVITFDEPVTVSAASFTLECPAGTLFAGGFAVSGSGTTIVTINPTGNLPLGTNCQVVIIAADVRDVDANDPPDLLDGNSDNVEGDDYTFSFTTDVDAAPTVVAVIPANGAVSVLPETNIEITFSELVNIAGAGDFALQCGGLPQGYSITTPATLPTSTTTVIIDPSSPLPGGEICEVVAYGGIGGIEDTDTDDPNDEMAANFVWTFTVEP